MGLILVQACTGRRDMTQVETRLREDMRHLREDMKRLDGRVTRLEHGQAKLEGLREAITRRNVA